MQSMDHKLISLDTFVSKDHKNDCHGELLRFTMVATERLQAVDHRGQAGKGGLLSHKNLKQGT